jgi:hypothetical protein
VADVLNQDLGVNTKLIEGNRGEFTVWVGDKLVANKVGDDFPPEQEVLSAVRKELNV